MEEVESLTQLDNAVATTFQIWISSANRLPTLSVRPIGGVEGASIITACTVDARIQQHPYSAIYVLRKVRREERLQYTFCCEASKET